MSDIATLSECKRSTIDRHVRPDDLKGFAQVLTTLLSIAGLWGLAVLSAKVSHALTAGVIVLMSLFLLRAFVLMHECGHASLFRSAGLNTTFGFVFGVLSGMPQYVWSRHHRYHHSTNGNWAKYRGPLNIIAVDEYAAKTVKQQKFYRRVRTIWLAPVAGFVYLIFNPRLNWLRGSLGFVCHLIRRKIAAPGVALRVHARSFVTSCWASAEEYRQMSWNNLVLLSLWAMMAWLLGPLLFFICYLSSASLAGGFGILLFTVQHNFEHSYASHDDGWDATTAAIKGTSFLILPRWLNWFTANIAYHHIHHLSARIPNYCLVECHHAHRHFFDGVTRLRLVDVPRALKYILWDTSSRRIISVAEYEQQAAQRSPRNSVASAALTA